MTRGRRVLFWVGLLVLVGMQFIPLDRSNPPVTGEISAPDPVMEVLRNSCYDCHSNETRWPWYSKVAPISWRVVSHVHEAREHLNFSQWQGMPVEDREHAMEEIWDEVESGGMPLTDYLWMHPEAEPTDPQKEALRRWVQGQAQLFPDWN